MSAHFRLLPVLVLTVQVLTCSAAAATALTSTTPHVVATGSRHAAPAAASPARASRPAHPAPPVHGKAVRPRPATPSVLRRRARAVAVVRRLISPAVPAPAAPIAAAVAVTAPDPQLSSQQALDQAVARIPGHADPRTRWVLTSAYGSWGTADWYHDVVYISPSVPSNRMYDVVIHEYSHLQSVVAYGGDVDLAMSGMNGYFGGTGLTGAERAADCMARLQGATWTHYTPCTDAHWRDGARRLVNGQKP